MFGNIGVTLFLCFCVCVCVCWGVLGGGGGVCKAVVPKLGWYGYACVLDV